MLSKRLEELSQNPDDPNGIAELSVTALGPRGSFYICWKTPSGQYRQDGHGLPQELQEWLFPVNGSARDFASLQVILGPGDGDFVASDCNGRVDRKTAEYVLKPLERARTFKSYDGATGSRPLSMVINPTDTTHANIRQRRAATVGSSSAYSESDRRTSVIPEEASSAAGRKREETPRLASLVPLAIRVNRFRRRPTSMHYNGSQPLMNIDPPQDTATALMEQSSRRRDSQNKLLPLSSQRASTLTASDEKPKEPISRYVDACVQTEAAVPLSPIQTTFQDYNQHRRHARDSSSASSSSSVFTSFSSEPSTRRSSFATEEQSYKSYQRPTFGYMPNPIMMGRMQDYFRATGYRLGDALQA
ncbi:hypothetical protein PFICI_02912 [Pestalotiopsis fici W106-1]|uniref:Uncharacterized protein n=1 Tax=Pestalotiopsis fici (strain W106-1 / CGMCC3.15140) TaxID=1229662 RepID=W3XHH9_PESFW|nr:uncharacterized protein PFICI_02912 [Pestalotiopsis fici W106-1]ETS84887.1 hypothetical protein PFICI_02912 [Pestalotiopsis fici W106-1]